MPRQGETQRARCVKAREMAKQGKQNILLEEWLHLGFYSDPAPFAEHCNHLYPADRSLYASLRNSPIRANS